MKFLKMSIIAVLTSLVFIKPVVADLDINFYGEAFPIVADDRRYGGGNERKFGELMINPSVDYKNKKIVVHIEGNTGVLDFSDNTNGQNKYYWRCDNVKNAPEFLGDVGYIGDNFYARIGALQFTGLERLNKSTVHHAFSPTGLEMITHYDIGTLLGYRNNWINVNVGCIDGDWQMGQSNIFDSDGVSNSSPGVTGNINIHSKYIDLGGSIMENRRGSNPGQKTYVNHYIGYVMLNKPLKLRGYYGNVERGHTWFNTNHNYQPEKTNIYGIESSIDIKRFIIYCSASKMDHISGTPQNIWHNNDTSFSEQYTASIGYRDIYIDNLNFSVGATMWNLDGSSTMNIGSSHEWAAYAVITYGFEIKNIKLLNLME